MSRTALFDAVRRELRLARAANRKNAPGVPELIERSRAGRLSRRRFLETSALTAAALATGCATRRASTPTPLPRADRAAARIAIVGGGIAGLNAAHRLAQAGVPATIYEAAARTGGRIHSATGLMAPGLTTELGGEFIDSGHEEMLALVRELGLELLDTQAESESALVSQAWLFGGSLRSETEVVEAFRPLAARMEQDLAGLAELVDFEHEGGGGALDRTTLADYLARAGASGWIADLLEVAYVTEYGLEAGEQSALNLLYLIGTDVAEGFAVFGESDERYKIRGGNQRVVDALAARLEGAIRREHRLLALHAAGDGYRLSFEGPGGAAVETSADVVVLALPFTLLREVELRVELPEFKRRAIAELGYGTNAKLFAAMDRRVWREQGFTGEAFSDQPFQLVWDNAQLQPGAAGGLTFYSGGRSGIAVGEGDAAAQVRRLLPGVERAFAGTTAAWSGKAERFHWPSHPFTRGSYACYRPGQWTTIAGAEGRPVGKLLFAGEHCSSDFQGFMNGGADTGKSAAEAILTLIGRAATAAAPRTAAA